MTSRRELEARIGAASELLGPRLSVAASGPWSGCRLATLHSGAGLEVSINCDRALDGLDAWFGGVPISFRAPGGATPDRPILDAWQGGLVTTCGFFNVGPPENGQGLHGNAWRLPVRDLAVTATWEDDELVSKVSGTTREASLFGPHIECRRTWTMRYGANRLELRDEIRNAGFEPQRIFVLYHCNLGWPLLDRGATVSIQGSARPRDEAAAGAVNNYALVDEPSPARPEEVLFHDVPADPDGWAHACVSGRDACFDIAWRPEQLPCFSQWRSFQSGSYALGLEPGNCHPLGAAAETEAGHGDLLAPGQTKTIELVCTLS